MKKTIKLLFFTALFIFLLIKEPFYTALLGGIVIALFFIFSSPAENDKKDNSIFDYSWLLIFIEMFRKKK